MKYAYRNKKLRCRIRLDREGIELQIQTKDWWGWNNIRESVVFSEGSNSNLDDRMNPKTFSMDYGRRELEIWKRGTMLITDRIKKLLDDYEESERRAIEKTTRLNNILKSI
jgi:hypothetical protein